MTMLDTGTQGAKRVAVKTDPLLNVVQDVMADLPVGMDPFADENAVVFMETIKQRPDAADLIEAIFSYYWANAVARVTKKPPTPEEKQARKTEQVERVERAKRDAIAKRDAQFQIMFLEMTMANGKTLRDCTRRELEQMRGTTSRVIAGIIRTLKKPGQKVGTVFTSNDDLLRFIPLKQRPAVV